MVRNMYRQALTLGLAMLLTGCGLFGKDKLEIDGRENQRHQRNRRPGS